MDMQRRCGEEHIVGKFYDRDGYYFREGVDPRNHIGRFVKVTHGLRNYASCFHLIGCPTFWGAHCDCGEPLNG